MADEASRLHCELASSRRSGSSEQRPRRRKSHVRGGASTAQTRAWKVHALASRRPSISAGVNTPLDSAQQTAPPRGFEPRRWESGVVSAPRRLVRDPSPRASLLRIRTRECQPVSARVGPPDPSDVAARLQRAGRSVPSDGCLMVVLVKPDARPVKNEIPLPPAPPPPPPTVRPSPSPTRAGAGTSSRSCPYASPPAPPPPPPLRRRPPGARWRPAAVAARAVRPNRVTRVRAPIPARRGLTPPQ
jgi:hypothetical protein